MGQCVGRERRTITGAEILRQAIFADQACEDGFSARHSGGIQCLALQQMTAIAIDDNQRVAIDTVAGPALAFDVCAQDGMGCVDRTGGVACTADVRKAHFMCSVRA